MSQEGTYSQLNRTKKGSKVPPVSFLTYWYMAKLMAVVCICSCLCALCIMCVCVCVCVYIYMYIYMYI